MVIEFRPTQPSDLPYVRAAEEDAENSRFIAVWSEEQHLGALKDPDIAHLLVVSCESEQPVGFVIMAGLQNEHQSVECKRIVITEKGKGYGRATMRAVKRFAFDELSAHRLWLDVKEHNVRARALYEKEGFRYEGTLRECKRESEGFSSLIIMSILGHEYRST